LEKEYIDMRSDGKSKMEEGNGHERKRQGELKRNKKKEGMEGKL